MENERNVISFLCIFRFFHAYHDKLEFDHFVMALGKFLLTITMPKYNLQKRMNKQHLLYKMKSGLKVRKGTKQTKQPKSSIFFNNDKFLINFFFVQNV